MNSQFWFQRFFRKLDEAGGARTISEAKRNIISAAHDEYIAMADDGYAVIDRADLKPSGVYMVKELARQGFARALFRDESGLELSWVVTEKPWSAEFIKSGAEHLAHLVGDE